MKIELKIDDVEVSIEDGSATQLRKAAEQLAAGMKASGQMSTRPQLIVAAALAKFGGSAE